MQNRTRLSLKAKGKEFGVKRGTRAYAQPPTPALALDVAFNIANLLGHGSSLSALVDGGTGGRRTPGTLLATRVPFVRRPRRNPGAGAGLSDPGRPAPRS